MNKQLVFIDESGDPGFKAASSDYFVMAAVVFKNPGEAELLMHEMDDYRKSLGWKYNHEFKFTKNPKSVVSELLRRTAKYNLNIYAVYLKKSDFRNITTSIVPFSDKDRLYNWVTKELILDIPLLFAKITIDGRATKQYRNNVASYLRKELVRDNTKKLEFKFDDSVRTNLLQLADLIAGSINRSLQADKTDSREYINIFKSKIKTIRKISSR